MSDTDDAVVGESSGAQVDELDSLLGEFDQPDQTGTEPKSKLTSDDVREVVDYVKTDRKEREFEATEKAIDSAADLVAENLSGVDLPKRAVRGMLIDMAETDRRFQKAFLERGSNPAGWNKILSATAQEFSKEFGQKEDKDLSEDKEAIASAVRSASTKVPEAQQDETSRRQEIRGMSDQELRAEKRKLGAY